MNTYAPTRNYLRYFADRDNVQFGIHYFNNVSTFSFISRPAISIIISHDNTVINVTNAHCEGDSEHCATILESMNVKMLPGDSLVCRVFQ